MANAFVVRQDTIEIQSIAPATTEFLGITPQGLVVTTGIPSGNFDDYTLLTETAAVSSNLQGQITALEGGLYSINSVSNPTGGNIDLITNTTEVSITPDDVSDEIAIDVDLSSYATITYVESVSGDLQNQIDNIEQESTVIQSSGASILVSQPSTNTWNVEVATAPIQNHNDLIGLQGGNGSDEYYHLDASQFADFIGATEVAAISGDLQGQITTNAGDILTNAAKITSNTANITSNAADIATNASDIDDLETDVAGISATIDNLDNVYVNVTGDTMTGDLQVPNLTVTDDAIVNGNLYVNGTEFIVDTTHVSASDNIISINVGDPGPGVTAGFAGIEVERGTDPLYQFLFRESDDAFVIGEVGDLQAVATREDVPTDGWLAQWNATEDRFDTIDPSSLTSAISADFVIKTGDTMTGDLNVSSANVNVTDGAVTIDGATQDYEENTGATAGTELIDSFAETLGYGAEWLIVIREQGGSDLRTSKVYAVWDRAGDVEFTEVGAKDIGNTNPVTIDVVESSNNIQLRAIITGGGTWDIKAIRTVL